MKNEQYYEKIICRKLIYRKMNWEENMSVRIDYEKCINCKVCYERCSEGLYGLNENGKVFVAYPDECWLCGACQMDCPVQAIQVKYSINNKPMFV